MLMESLCCLLSAVCRPDKEDKKKHVHSALPRVCAPSGQAPTVVHAGAVVTLFVHCCYTVVTLLLHCCYSTSRVCAKRTGADSSARRGCARGRQDSSPRRRDSILRDKGDIAVTRFTLLPHTRKHTHTHSRIYTHAALAAETACVEPWCHRGVTR
jgi:hypothetical protein